MKFNRPMAAQSTPEDYILAIDYGEARLGLAVAHEKAKLPQPLGVIPRENAVQALKKIVEKEKIKTMVLGLPRNLSGEETAQTKTIRAFASKLKGELNQTLVLVDESLSTVRAQEMAQEYGRNPKEPIDDIAACFILEEFFARNDYEKV